MRHQDLLKSHRRSTRFTAGRWVQSVLAGERVGRQQSSVLILLAVLAILGLFLSACAADLVITATPVPPTLSPTPRSTLLPTVATQIPFGSADRPYQMLVVPPPDSAATEKALNAFLQSNLKVSINVQIVSTYGDIVAALCSPSPTIAWGDGWTVLRILAEKCAEPILKIKRGDATGVAADLLVSTATNIKTLDGLRTTAKSRDYCRVSAQDDVSWILPALLMRTAKGFEPLTDFRSIKDIPDITTTIHEVAFNRCVTAILTGTLDQYKVQDISDVTKVVTSLGTTPELPYGALLVSTSFPKDLADEMVKLFTDNPDQLKDYLTFDSFVSTSDADFADIQKFAESAGMDLASSGQSVPVPSSLSNPGQ